MRTLYVHTLHARCTRAYVLCVAGALAGYHAGNEEAVQYAQDVVGEAAPVHLQCTSSASPVHPQCIPSASLF